MFVPDQAPLPDAVVSRFAAGRAGTVPDPIAGAGPAGRAGAACPSAARIATNACGSCSYSPSGPKKSRAASCALARISRGELIGASMRFVSQASS